jgi:hypothetical protein
MSTVFGTARPGGHESIAEFRLEFDDVELTFAVKPDGSAANVRANRGSGASWVAASVECQELAEFVIRRTKAVTRGRRTISGLLDKAGAGAPQREVVEAYRLLAWFLLGVGRGEQAWDLIEDGARRYGYAADDPVFGNEFAAWAPTEQPPGGDDG